jgi:HSP20 family protein
MLRTAARPAAMPMDAYRQGGNFYICLDLPGVNAESIDLTVEQNVLTVRAERAPVQADGAQMIVAERPYGTFTRQVFLGETLDAEHIAADYAAGALTLTIPVHEAAKPRSIEVTSSDTKQAVTPRRDQMPAHRELGVGQAEAEQRYAGGGVAVHDAGQVTVDQVDGEPADLDRLPVLSVAEQDPATVIDVAA